MPGTPITEEEKAEIKRLHGEGKSCRQIADAIDRAPNTVSKHAAEMGLTFDREKTEAGTRAVMADNRARRAAIIEWQYRRCLKLAERLDGDTFTTLSRTPAGALPDELPFVPTDDELALSRAMGQYAKTAADLEKLDIGSGAEQAKSMLGDLISRLRTRQQGDS